MHAPPIDPRDRPVPTDPSWKHVAVSYALAGAVLLSFWVVSNPVAGTVGIVAVAGLVHGTRRTVGLVRCLRDCGGFAVDLVGDVRVTVSRRSAGVEPVDEASTASGTATCC